MSVLEIVHLRSSSEPIEDLAELIRESMWEEGRNNGVFTCTQEYLCQSIGDAAFELTS